jgi:ATP-dependent helicase/DNAse subunit B
MSKKEHVKLSASKVKTLLDCSWVYWCKYHLKLPDSSNDGAKRGSCVHELFEALTKKRLMSFAVKFQADGCDVEKYKSVHRFLMKRCKKYSLNPDTVEKKSGKTNFDLMVEMVNVGLSNKFFPEEHEEIIDSEYAFDITHDDMNFRMVGFIDKILFDKKNKTLFISDYKSSKMKFAGAELDGNIQAMMYSLAADTLKKNKKIPNFKKSVIRFIFLRFCSNPFQ